MNVLLQMAVTPNGFVAGLKHDTSFVTKREWKEFAATIQRTGNLIVGRKTYELMDTDGNFETFKGLHAVVIVTRKPFTNKPLARPRVFSAKNPKTALRILERHGFKTALVGGGGKLNASFLKAGLVDELRVDVEPALVANGTPLLAFGKNKADARWKGKLKLVSVRRFSKDEVQLRYRVAL